MPSLIQQRKIIKITIKSIETKEIPKLLQSKITYKNANWTAFAASWAIFLALAAEPMAA